MAEALVIAQVAGTAMQVMGALQEGEETGRMYEYNAGRYGQMAGFARQKAGYTRQAGAANAEAQQRNANKAIGRIRGSIAASGITSDGSALDVLASSAASAELDRLNILHGAELQALSSEQEAMGYERSAELDRRRASYARESSWGKAGSALLTGAAGIYGGGGMQSMNDYFVPKFTF